MASVARRPLSGRQSAVAPPIHPPISPIRYPGVLQPKRPRSPEHEPKPEDRKRLKSAVARYTEAKTSKQHDDLMRSKMERQAKRHREAEEFRVKYSKVFPKLKFYFEDETIREKYEELIIQLGGTIHEFFSKAVSHLISDTPIPIQNDEDKENYVPTAGNSKGKSALQSPIKLRSTVTYGGNTQMFQVAVRHEMKIWNSKKLESVLSRLLEIPSPEQPPSLTHMLEQERRYGTSERDPTQRRADYKYFRKGSYFLLIEDIHGELAPIATQEYYAPSRDSTQEPTYPILHCDPRARGPFMKYDEKEERRAQRQEKQDLNLAEQHRRAKSRLKARRREGAESRLRRAMSMGDLDRREARVDVAPVPPLDEASGIFDSMDNRGYIAASGNSVSITSNVGTTSTTGLSGTYQPVPLPGFRKSLHRQAVLSRKFANQSKRLSACDGSSKQREESMMPPPDRILRRSRSTNTFKPPKRDEAAKPGFCESCRVKFNDFKEHIVSKKHRKFAMNGANFALLDAVLSRVQRRHENQLYGPSDDDLVDDSGAVCPEDSQTSSDRVGETITSEEEEFAVAE